MRAASSAVALAARPIEWTRQPSMAVARVRTSPRGMLASRGDEAVETRFISGKITSAVSRLPQGWCR
jgi:hypothetical protein